MDNHQEFFYYDVLSDEEPPHLTGPLHGLVYCPGSINLKPFRLITPEQYRVDMEVNFIGAVKTVKYYLPLLQQSGNAAIVLFSSVAAGVGMYMHASIAAAKGAVEAWMRVLAAELSPGVRVNAISPSLVETPLTRRLTDSEAKLKVAGDRHPLKRIGQPDEIAALTTFLLSDNASWITGQVIRADGGMHAIRS